MNGLDLFSGIGGMSLALQEWVTTICYCENDSYCQGVLLSRMFSGELPTARIWDDIKTFPSIMFADRTFDIVFAGFPCQDINIAGTGKGLAGERSGLFFEIIRILRESRPRFLFLENVPAITTRGGIEVVKEITSLGYDCRWCVLSASEIGAVHRRQRFFLLAYTNSQSSGQADKKSEPKQMEEKTRLRPTRQNRRIFPFIRWDEGKCPSIGMDDGLPFELDRARSLGNSVCPMQAREAFKILMGLKDFSYRTSA